MLAHPIGTFTSFPPIHLFDKLTAKKYRKSDQNGDRSLGNPRTGQQTPPYVEPRWELDAAAPPHNNPAAPEGIYARVPRIPAHERWQKRQHTLRAAPAHPRRQVVATPGRRTVGGEGHGGRGPPNTGR